MTHRTRVNITLFLLAGALGTVAFLNVQTALVLLLAALALMFLSRNPLYCLGTFILLAPFYYTDLFNHKIAGIPGMKIPNLLLVLVLILYFASETPLRSRKSDLAFLSGIALLLSFSVLRSLPDIETINYLTEDHLDTKQYLLSYLIRPLTYLVPFFVITGYVRKEKDIRSIANLLMVSVAILSVAIFYLYVAQAPSKTNFKIIRSTLSFYLNTHSNNIANFYILVFPFILARYFYKKDVFSLTLIVMSVVSVGLLFSRTAYVLLPASVVLMLFISNKKRFIPVAIAVALLVILISPRTIKERSMHGFVEGDLNKISAGRIERIWNPLLRELKNDPSTIFIGQGRHAVILSGSAEENHAHNMYLGTFFETGAIGMLFFAVCLFYLITRLGKWAIGTPESYQHLLLQGALVSIVAYLTAGLTGRHLFPYMGNLFFWIVIGLALAIVRTRHAEEKVAHAEKAHLLCRGEHLSPAGRYQ